ncbi:MAG: hypothetical protein CFE21_02010 [Bacteroidetes bacterium B1(2017)]|nr:MAG: hypothetical protein CFE21_02010 [Bacteroidetes bacterium B1(2017)]
MKNQGILWPLAAAYTFLLYQQGAGINILLLNLLLLGVLYAQHKAKLIQKENLIFVFGALFSAVFVSIHGHFLSVLANIISLAFLSINLSLQKSSMASLLAHSLYAYLTTLINRLIQRFNQTPVEENETELEKPKLNKVIIGLISVVVFGLFITFYRYSSASFNQFVLNLNLDFISFPLLAYFAFASALLATFLRPIYLENLATKELGQTNALSFSVFKEYKLFGSNILEITEDSLAKVLLWGLNLMLLLVNVLDTDFMLTGKLPVGVNYSEYLHQGITSLILSIICAIAIILWFFRGSQNFKENKTITYLTYFWIVLNIWLLASAAYRNQLYIADHSLYTYKRIGVYVFLFCALIGLGLTFFKIKNHYSNYYLLKTNSLVWYTILILSVSINWDGFIATNHLQAAKERHEAPDINYLKSLNYQAYPAVIEYLTEEMKKDSSQLEFDPYYYNANTQDLLQKIINKEQDYTWKSYNYTRCKGYSQIHRTIAGVNFNLVQAYYQRNFAIYNEFRNPFNF